LRPSCVRSVTFRGCPLQESCRRHTSVMTHLGYTSATHRSRHRSPSTRKTSAKTHPPSVTTHTGNFLKGAKAHRPSVAATKHAVNFGQCTSAIGHQAHGKLRPRHVGRMANTHTRNFGQDTSAIGPSTRETSAKTHPAKAQRPSVTTHMGNFGRGTSAIGHQAHGKLRPMHIGHRSPSTWETSAKTHRPSVIKHTGNFGQDTSAICQHTGNFGQDTSAIGHHTHKKLRPRHIGHRSKHTRETSAKAHRPLVTKHMGNFG